jgi:hypothetical protein
VAIPFRTIADSISATRTGSATGGGTAASAMSITTPITTTLLNVPKPGRWRNGTHSSITSAPMITTQVPTPRPSRRESP